MGRSGILLYRDHAVIAQRPLILVHPPCDRFLFRNISDRESLKCTVIGPEEMPLDPMGFRIEPI
jgi:hypothetical protein